MLERYFDEWSSVWTKHGWLDYLQNTYGNFKVAAAFLDAQGNPVWTKHIPYLQLQHLNDDDYVADVRMTKKEFLAALNNRTILETEVVIDIDKPEYFNSIITYLQKEHTQYELWHTGSKGYHIHLILPELGINIEHPKQWRETFLRLFSADTAKKTTGAMIALENTPHWKTGKVKHLVGSN